MDSLVLELRVTFDDMEFVERPIESPGFLSSGLSNQLSVIERMITQTHAYAGLWIDKDTSGSMRVHLVVLGDKDALIYSFRSDTSPSEDEELLVSIHELVTKGELGSVLQEQPVDTTRIRRTDDISRPLIKAGGHFLVQQGLASPAKNHFALGVAANVQVLLPWNMYLGIPIGASFFLPSKQDENRLWTWQFVPSLEISKPFSIGKGSLGPLVGLSLVVSRVYLSDGEGATDNYHYLSLKPVVGATAGLPISKRSELYLRFLVGWMTNRITITGNQSQTEFFTTPLIDFQLAVGFLFTIL